MGGNALKNIETQRLSLSEYTRVLSEIIQILEEEQIEYQIGRELPRKESFGDIDVLLSWDRSDVFVPWLHRVFPSDEYKHCGEVHSFAYEDRYQIDFVIVDKLDLAHFYFSYGDMGTIVGRCARRQKLQFGHNGLFALIEDDQRNVVFKLLLCEDPAEICSFFHLSYEEWTRGEFSTWKEVCEWILTCRFFRKSIFQEELSGHYRKRTKRPFYAYFLDLLNDDSTQYFEETVSLEDILKYFRKEEEWKTIQENIRMEREFKQKYNARLFINEGIPPKQVGVVMQKFVDKYGPITNGMLAEDILDMIKSFVGEYRELNC